MDWTSYHPVADMQDFMAYLADTYSDFVSVVSIGKSYEGNDMQVPMFRFTQKNFIYIKKNSYYHIDAVILYIHDKITLHVEWKYCMLTKHHTRPPLIDKFRINFRLENLLSK
jgi:hypothetical protein